MPSSTTTPDAMERVRYFSRQLITADDMRAEQEYLLHKLRRHNRMMHGTGVVCGLTVTAAPDASHPLRVSVSEGYALAPRGDEICVPALAYLDLAECSADAESACTPATSSSVVVTTGSQRPNLLIGVRYDECPSRPVRVMPAGCGCGDSSCDYSRTRDGFALGCWPEPEGWEPPGPPNGNCAEIAQELRTCSAKPGGPWVLLAHVTFSGTGIKTIDPTVRRWLFSTAAIQGVACRGGDE